PAPRHPLHLHSFPTRRSSDLLNLSTLQSLYSARIIRAYLGASNHARFAPGTGAKARDVAEPIKGDSLSVDDIHRNPLAPIHFVRSEEHTSELQSRENLVCRLL